MNSFFNNLKIYLTRFQRLALFGLIFLMTISALLEIIGIGIVPIFVAALLDYELLNQYLSKFNFEFLDLVKELNQKQLLFYMTIFIICLFILKNLFILIVNYLVNYFNYEVNCNNSEKLFKKYLYNSYSFHLNRNSSTLIKNIVSEINTSSIYLMSVVFLIREILIFSLTCFLLLINSPFHFIYISLILLFFLIIIYLILRKKITKSGEEFYKSREKLFFTIQQSLGFIKEIILLNKKKIFYDIYKKHLYSTEYQNVFLNTINKIPRVSFELLAVFLILAIVYYFFENSKNQLLPMLSLYGIALIRLIPSYASMSTSIMNLRFFKISFDEITKEISSMNYENDTKNYYTNSHQFNYKNNKNINIKDLSFRYDKSTDVLRNINLNFKTGEAIGIIGESGSGKTTLGDLLMGLYEPTKGSLTYDGVEISKYKNQWKNIIGYVSQDVFLLDTTIRNNIAVEFDSNKINENDLNNAINLSNCKEFIDKLSEGLDTNVGERGVKLSGGQKQRIGIARALYKNPSIILFDEATSSLDEKNEKKIIKSIQNLKGDKTMICISHKLSNLEQMDKIILIEDKTLKQIGKPEEIFNFIKKKDD